jgi:hypothetical protein
MTAFSAVRFLKMLARICEHFLRRQYPVRERFAGTAHIDLFYFLALSPSFALRLLPYGLSVISRCSVSKPLSDDALYRAGSALNVIYAKPNAIGIAEIELREIAVQMLFIAMLVDTLHAALENRIEALDGVGVDRLDMKPVRLVNPNLIAHISQRWRGPAA